MAHNLSKKAKAYLKAQGGLQVPYEYPYQDNSNPFDLSQFEPNLEVAQQNQLLQNPVSPGLQINNPSQNKNQTLKGIGDGIPLLGSALKLGTGIYSLIEAGKARKAAKNRKRHAEDDLKRRMEESRQNDYYYTGNAIDNYSDFNKLGGKIKYQQGGFMDFYNQMEQSNKNRQNMWEGYYDQYIQEGFDKANNLKQEGLTNTISGGLDLASSLLFSKGGVMKRMIRYQNGGSLLNPDSLMQRSTTRTTLNELTPDFYLQPDTVTNESIDRAREQYIYNYKKENPAVFDLIHGKDPEKTSLPRYKRFYKSDRMKQEGGDVSINEDLYSPDFQSPVQENNESYFTELRNKYQAVDPQGSFENQAMSWIFEEDPQPSYPLDDFMDNDLPSTGDIATTHNNPGNIKYGQFAQKYGATIGRNATDGGQFARFPSVEVGLQAQKDLLISGNYANLTVENAMKRWSNDGYGADLYPEIANKKMKDLTPKELNELILRQTKRESPTIFNKIYNQ